MEISHDRQEPIGVALWGLRVYYWPPLFFGGDPAD